MKKEIKFFYAFAYAKSKNIILMYSSMHSHIKKKKFYALIRTFLKKNLKMKNKVICIFISSYNQ